MRDRSDDLFIARSTTELHLARSSMEQYLKSRSVSLIVVEVTEEVLIAFTVAAFTLLLTSGSRMELELYW